jgi:hypothetical protein
MALLFCCTIVAASYNGSRWISFECVLKHEMPLKFLLPIEIEMNDRIKVYD